jgi:hypothetical protein
MHDADHPGYNNAYFVNTFAPIAIRYNDNAVLENHHVATAFKIIFTHEDCNILESLSKDELKKARKAMIGMILATDMARHFGDLGKLKARIESSDYSPKDTDKASTQEFLFHMADISNPTRPWAFCKKWTDLLFIEFFQQGDKERELGIDISFLMDRATTNVAKAQDGFIKGLIKPAFAMLEGVMPRLGLNLKYMNENIEQWANKVVQYSIMTHSHMETIKSKKNLIQSIDEEEKSSSSEESVLKNEDENSKLSSFNGSNINSNFRKDLVSLYSSKSLA